MCCPCVMLMSLVPIPGTFLLSSLSDIPLAILPCNEVAPHCMPHGRPPPFLLVATLLNRIAAPDTLLPSFLVSILISSLFEFLSQLQRLATYGKVVIMFAYIYTFCGEPTPEPELSQLLFYQHGQRELVRVPTLLVCLLIHISNGLCTYYPALLTK